MSDAFGQLNLFARPDPPQAPRQRPAFDPYHHPCVVCGDLNAPFGVGWPDAPQFFCRDHEARHDIPAPEPVDRS
jgi:hypothetical protein